MTVSSEVKRFSNPGSGTTGPFTIGFPILAETDLLITKVVDATGVETTLTLNAGSSGYTVNAALTEVTTTEAVAVGETIVGVRNLSLTQGSDYIANDPFPAEVTETALDRLTMIAQQLQENIDRTIKLSVTSSLTGVTFPDPTGNASKYLRVNSSADGYEHFDIAGVGNLSVSAFAETLLDDTTAAAARTTLDAQEDLSGATVTAATATTSDKVLIQDADDSDNLKQDTISDILGLYAALTATLTNKTIATGGGNDVQTQFKIGSGTRDNTTANGTQAITGVGFSPRAVVVLAVGNSADTTVSVGWSDGTTHNCIYQTSTAGDWLSNGSSCIVMDQSSGATNNVADIDSLDADGFTLDWTKLGSPSGSAAFYYLAIR